MNILDLLSGQLDNENVIKELKKSTGADTDKIQQAVKLGIPALMQAMDKNANTQQGASSLAKALDQHKDDNVDDIGKFLKGVNTEDGSKMLEHIFGNDNKKIQSNLSKQTGLKEDEVSGMMEHLAPLLMGMLGKQKSSKNASADDLSSMLKGLMGSGGNKDIMNTVTNLIDADVDGNIMDDIGKMAGGFFKKK